MEIKKVGVVGCGLMGAGIAQTVAEGGYATIVREPTRELLDKGLERIRSSLAKGVEKGKVTAARRDQVWGLVRGTTELGDLADCDLVIEAIVEVRDAKRNLFAELDRVCKPGAILVTNTSSFSVVATYCPSGETRDRKPMVLCPLGLSGKEFQLITSSFAITISRRIGATT